MKRIVLAVLAFALLAALSIPLGASTATAKARPGSVVDRHSFTYGPDDPHTTRSRIRYTVGPRAVTLKRLLGNYNLGQTRTRTDCARGGFDGIRIVLKMRGAGGDRSRTLRIPCESDTTGRRSMALDLRFEGLNPCPIGWCPPAVNVKVEIVFVLKSTGDYRWESPWTFIS